MQIRIPIIKNKLKFSELTSFTRQFSAMLEARISLVRILDILYQQTESEALKKILKSIKNEVQGGKTLTEAFAGYPDIFSAFYLNMLQVGEMTGRLDYMLSRTALYLEKINALRRKLLQSLTYPALVVFVAVGAVTFLLTYVVPTFPDMFRDFDAQLPTITKALMQVSNMLTTKMWFVLLFIAALIMIARYYFATRRGKLLKDNISLVLPISGSIIRKNFISRFSRTLSILLESGVPMLEALKVTAESIPNIVVQQEIRQMRYFAEKGELLTRSLKRCQWWQRL